MIPTTVHHFTSQKAVIFLDPSGLISYMDVEEIRDLRV
jgi:hypothetical protein